MIADFENVQESEASEIYAQRFHSQEVPVKNRIRISVCKRNSENSWSSKAIIDSRGKHRART